MLKLGLSMPVGCFSLTMPPGTQCITLERLTDSLRGSRLGTLSSWIAGGNKQANAKDPQTRAVSSACSFGFHSSNELNSHNNSISVRFGLTEFWL